MMDHSNHLATSSTAEPASMNLTAPLSNSVYGGIHNQGGPQLIQSTLSGVFHFGGQDPVREETGSRSRTPPKPSSTVPFGRDPDFVDRGNTLSLVHESLNAPAARVALVGLGGVGKSQLAIEYSYQTRDENPQMWIFWVYASSMARFEQSYQTIAEQVQLFGREDSKKILSLVFNWLSDNANGRWLIILDNADDDSIFSSKQPPESHMPLSAYLPQTNHGSILVTSRNKEVAAKLTGSYANIIEVPPMSPDESLELLWKKLGNNFDEDHTRQLAQELDYMPLAISQAVAYINQRAPRVSVQRYITMLHKAESEASILDKDLGDLRRDGSAKNSIFSTWQITFEQIRAERRSASDLLSFISFFDRQGIPDYLLRKHRNATSLKNSILNTCQITFDQIRAKRRSASNQLSFMSFFNRRSISDYPLHTSSNDTGEPNAETTSYEFDIDVEFEDDVDILRRYSLVVVNSDHSLEMHRLVQLVTRRWLDTNNEAERWRRKYAKMISKELFNKGVDEKWKVWQALFPHAQSLLNQRPASEDGLKEWASAATKVASFMRRKGDLAAAEQTIKQAIDVRKRLLGTKDASYLMSLRIFTLVLLDQQKLKAAEEQAQLVLDGSKLTLGKSHQDTLFAMKMLMHALGAQHKYQAAESLGRKAQQIYKRKFIKDEKAALDNLIDLALALSGQEKYEAAESLIQEALEGQERALGETHPRTLKCLFAMAVTLSSQEKYEAAEPLAQRALEGFQTLYGKGHINTLKCMSEMLHILKKRRKFEAAITLAQEVLGENERVYGKDNLETLHTVHHCAWLLVATQQHAAALDLYLRACEGFTKILGASHKDTIQCLNEYSALLDEMNGPPLSVRELGNALNS